jgi:hypothetical protein
MAREPCTGQAASRRRGSTKETVEGFGEPKGRTNACGLLCLFDIVETVNRNEDTRPMIPAFWPFARTGENERSIRSWASFRMARRNPGVHVYCYNQHEPMALHV